MNTPVRFLILALALATAACGREDASDDAGATPGMAPSATADAGAPPAEASVPPSPVEPVAAPEGAAPTDASGAQAPLAASDLDAYVRGVQREIEALQQHADALAAARAAKDENAELAAMMALSSVQVRDAGAAEAGMDAARYAWVKDSIDEVLAANEMAAAMKPQLDASENADLSGFTEEQRKQHAEGIAQMRAAWEAPYARLPADFATALKAREAELSRLRADALALRLGALKN